MTASATSTPVRLQVSPQELGQPSDAVHLTYEQRVRSRLAVQLESGRDATIILPRGRVMRGGDRLRGDDGTVVEIVAAAEPLLEAQIEDARQLARAAYHLGNRHVAVEVRDGALRIARDPVLGPLLLQLGLAPEEIEAPFEPESGAYGHSHAHVSGPHAAASMIHEFHQGAPRQHD
jgi:urease accessory protein